MRFSPLGHLEMCDGPDWNREDGEVCYNVHDGVYVENTEIRRISGCDFQRSNRNHTKRSRRIDLAIEAGSL